MFKSAIISATIGLAASIATALPAHASDDVAHLESLYGPKDTWPYCGDLDSGLAEPSPVCNPWDGDIEAQADPEPSLPCPSGRETHLDCYEYGFWDDVPDGIELRKINLARENGSGEAVAYRVKAHWAASSTAAKHPCYYNLYWWCKNHTEAPGRDEDPSDGGSRDVSSAPDRPNDRPSYDRPDRGWTETPSDPNPWSGDSKNDRDQPSKRDYKDKHGIGG